MAIKKEYTAFRAEGYRAWGSRKKSDRMIYISINNSSDYVRQEFTVDEAKQIISEIKEAIKESKVEEHDEFF